MNDSPDDAGTPRIEIGRRVLVCPGGHAPKAVRLGDDHLLVAARTGLTGVGNNSSVSVVESQDGGRTWTGPRVLIDSRHDERVQMMSRLPGGGMLLGFTRRSNGACKGMLMNSSDEGRSWDDPFELGAGTVRLRLPVRGCDGAAGRRTPAHRLRRLLPGLRTWGQAPGTKGGFHPLLPLAGRRSMGVRRPDFPFHDPTPSPAPLLGFAAGVAAQRGAGGGHDLRGVAQAAPWLELW